MGDLTTIITLMVITVVPAIELRGSILYGLTATNLSPVLIFAVCVLINMILGPVAYFGIDKSINFFQRFERFNRHWQRHVEKTQIRLSRYIEKYGILGLSIFIAIPLPGSGSYTGALGAKLLGIKFKKFMIANMIGVIIAGIIVTLIVSSGGWLFNLLF